MHQKISVEIKCDIRTASDGSVEGSPLGDLLGTEVGNTDGITEGSSDGELEGSRLGFCEGETDGNVLCEGAVGVVKYIIVSQQCFQRTNSKIELNLMILLTLR